MAEQDPPRAGEREVRRQGEARRRRREVHRDDLWVARANKDKGLAHVSNAEAPPPPRDSSPK